ncbi:MAG: hypothetical protein A2Y57_02720 [Candidatus Woykebacteria bacterium RBG_13_40_7b]|uniref:Uncharacterized protein n=1 Tax=Candidatus Woykebacteria bacterium RBG_13_40_7b TaxID=1802594 RepID=A0A1G1WBJ3_9BACT|nr:MAG: hypothetical protein A2Y57_02720 [Candidatus Woykebacteria bacterium RBG_13_40_7b]
MRSSLKYIHFFLVGIVSLFFVSLIAKLGPVYADGDPHQYCDTSGPLCDGISVTKNSWTEPDQGDSYSPGGSITFTSSYHVSFSGESANLASNGDLHQLVTLYLQDGSSTSVIYNDNWPNLTDFDYPVNGSLDVPSGWPTPDSAFVSVEFTYGYNVGGGDVIPIGSWWWTEDISIGEPGGSSTPEPSSEPTDTPQPGSQLSVRLSGRVLSSDSWSETGVSGDAPLNDVDLQADARLSSGTFGIGTIQYRFDCTDDGTFEHTGNSPNVMGRTHYAYSVADLCDYPVPGTYTVRVRVRDPSNYTATDTLPITVTGIAPPDLIPFPACSNYNVWDDMDPLNDPTFSITPRGGNLFNFGIHWSNIFQGLPPQRMSGWLPLLPPPATTVSWRADWHTLLATGDYFWSALASDSGSGTVTSWATPQPFSIDLFPPSISTSNPMNGSVRSSPPNADEDATLGDIKINANNIGCGQTQVKLKSLKRERLQGTSWVDPIYWNKTDWASALPVDLGFIAGGIWQGPTSASKWQSPTETYSYNFEFYMKDVLDAEANGQKNEKTEYVWFQISPGSSANAWLQTENFGDIHADGVNNGIRLCGTPNNSYISLNNSLITSRDPSSAFGVAGTCTTSYRAHSTAPTLVPEWTIREYQAISHTSYSFNTLYDKYYSKITETHNPADNKITGGMINSGSADEKIIQVIPTGGDTEITIDSLTVAADQKTVVFVGTTTQPVDLLINGQITANQSNNGVVFIVSGNIKVSNLVNSLDGIYLANNQFFSANGGTSTSMLTVNGSAYGLSGYNFSGRNNSVSSQPSEKFFFQPKYLYLFRDLIGKISFTWQEVAP